MDKANFFVATISFFVEQVNFVEIKSQGTYACRDGDSENLGKTHTCHWLWLGV